MFERRAFFNGGNMTENSIIDIVYSLYETDDDGWDVGSDEYLAARKYCNTAIARWERYDNTTWRDLWATLTAAADGTKTLTADTYDYTCPTNFLRPGSWVRTGSTPQFWQVLPPEKVAEMDSSTAYYCYFTGNVKDGFTLNFNPELTLTTDDVIYYEYYKTATTFTAITSETEMADPYFIVFYVLARFLKNDGEDYSEEGNQADDLLENMRVVNMSSYQNIPNQIEQSITNNAGFGYA